ncbi:unnamed protein product [Rhodiola kirilowii]
MESFLAGLLSLAVLFVLVSIWRNVSDKCKKHHPPEAAQAWPLIGHLYLMARSKSPHKMLGAMADKYGPIFAIRLGMRRVLVINSSVIARECFTANDIAVSSRPKSVSLNHLSYNYAMFGFAPYGPYWRELRKIATLELLSTKRIELLKHVRVFETHSFIRELYTSSCYTNSLEGPVNLNMKELFGKLTFNITLQMVVGKRYYERYSNNSDAEKDTTTDATMYRQALKEFFRLAGLSLLGDAFPFLRWLDIGGHEKEMKSTARELDRIANQWLDEHKKNMSSEKQDFMDVMLSMLDEDTSISSFDKDTINKATCFGLIAGGTHTTSATLEWTLSLLVNNPKVLRKAQEELDLHVGKSRLVNESDIGNLEYLRALVKESMRLCPAGPLGIYRELREDCTIGGYRVAKGTHLLVNAWKIQHDPDIWENPSEFRPERFLTSHKDVDVRGVHYELLPFGCGRRICPGITFSNQVLHLVLATFLQAFSVRNASDGLVDMSESCGMGCVKAIPLEVVITPRLPSELYE